MRNPIRTVAWAISARDGLTPIENDVFYDLSTGETYKYNGKKWVKDKFLPDSTEIVPTPVVEEAPKNPHVVTKGDVLHDSETGKDFVREGNKWVEKPAPKRTRKKVEK